MISIRVTGKLTFPHYVRNDVGALQNRQYGDPYRDQKTGEMVRRVATVMSDGTFNLISNPDKPVKRGDQLAHPFYGGLSYRVDDIIEEREAKGDYSFVGFVPLFQKVSVTLE